MVRLFSRLLFLAVVFAACGLSGCSYLHARGNDTLDMLDFGITLSSKPGFAIYPSQYFNITPLGYSNVDGRYLGWANAQAGYLPFKDESWGVLLTGREHLRIGDFNPDDPHQFSQSDLRELREAGKPVPTESPQYNVGLVKMIRDDNAPPWPSFLSCRRNVHFGWIGIHAALHPADIVDFLLGWTTVDIMSDDERDLKKRAQEGA